MKSRYWEDPGPCSKRDARHELANELTAIVLLADKAMGRVPTGDPLRRDLEAIRAAGQRALSLGEEIQAHAPTPQ